MKTATIAIIALAALAGCAGDEVTGGEPTVLRTVDEIEQFASFEDMVLSTDLVVEGEVVAIEPGRVVGTPEHREELAVATVRVARVLHRGPAVATDPREVAIEFPRFVDIAGHGRRRIVRSDQGDQYELGETGFYLLRRTREDTYRTVNIQGRIPVRDGQVDAPEAAASLVGPDPSAVRVRIETAVRQAETGTVAP